MPRLTSRSHVLAVSVAALTLADVVCGVALARPGAVDGTGTSRPAAATGTVVWERLPPASIPAAPAIQDVAASAPTSFRLTGPHVRVAADVCAMPNVRPYDPPGEQHHTVCWVREGFGVAPGSAARTSYLFGHSWAEDDQEVLNAASSVATREILRGRTAELPSIAPGTGGITAPSPTTTVYPVHALAGSRIVLRTGTGVLTYEVRTVYGVLKDHLGYIGEWQDESVPDRLVLTTCAEYDGADYDYNVVIEAYLVKARPIG
ncbi:MAG: sortase domain-containing protein [Jatrophihabitans sp.]|uniref:sortase domain-containing protein n=1 Tax=Jatrophihabitans sp. TaxID=1932789 RepID=UPI003F7EA56F